MEEKKQIRYLEHVTSQIVPITTDSTFIQNVLAEIGMAKHISRRGNCYLLHCIGITKEHRVVNANNPQTSVEN